ncbi:senescence/dehydration-associated protein At3g51250-like [Hordeum vulgare subsp. vulgare]|uniref:senescence/dehydration-associated protein At3g51250-like n=1 Tax=Hordeum vulgare subsp. vulgare TaxID=112509 RepID=UPI001D1A3CAA|nr:senescence/dehydration-associated protein At3g51250-like [Hordeum vulgare subsp. vulgare]
MADCLGCVALDDGVLHKVEAAAYWTAVAPNVEEYGSVVARAITSGDENVAKGILWRGVMTRGHASLGNEVLEKRIQIGDTKAEVSPEMLGRIKWFSGSLALTIDCVYMCVTI